MASKELFHIRRQLCTLQRQLLARYYTSEAQPPSPTSLAPDPVRFLQAADQAALRLAKQRLETVTNHAKHTAAQVAAFPTALPVPITTRKPTVRNASEDPYETTFVPYQMGSLRARQIEQPIVLDNFLKKAEHINQHITDLQFQPYTTSTGEPINPAFTKWQQEISEMNAEEKELALKELGFEEQAMRSRLMAESKRLLEIVREVEAASRKYGGPVDVDAPMRAGNPFTIAPAQGQGGSASSTTTKADRAEPKERKGSIDEVRQDLATTAGNMNERKEVKKATPASAASIRKGTMSTLLDLQRKISESMRSEK